MIDIEQRRRVIADERRHIKDEAGKGGDGAVIADIDRDPCGDVPGPLDILETAWIYAG